MKKVLIVVVALLMVIGNIGYVFAAGYSDGGNTEYDNAYSYLTSNGVSAESLETMEYEDVMSMYDDLKDKHIGSATYEKQYLKVMDGEPVQVFGDLSSADMVLSMNVITTTTDINSSKDQVLDVMPYITYQWKKNPGIKKDDKVSINWTTGDFNYTAGTYSHKRYYKSGDYKLFSTITSPTQSNTRGFGVAVSWLSSNYNLMKGYIKFNMSPQGNKYQYATKSKNNYATTFNVNYVHNGSPVKSLTFGYAGLGITIGLSDQTSSTSASGTINYAKK